jgi:hypothetical protein
MLNPKTEVAMGSAPAPGAVFRALLRRAKARQRDGGAETPGRSKKFQIFEVFRTPNGWIRGRIQQRPARACSPTPVFGLNVSAFCLLPHRSLWAKAGLACVFPFSTPSRARTRFSIFINACNSMF